MRMQIWVIAAAVAAVTADLLSSTTTARKDDGKLSSHSSLKGNPAAREYNFVYGISDPVASSLFGHQEFSDGKTISGSYHVRLPDGRHQTVIYQDDGTGFVADVSYDHIARQPDFNLFFESTHEPTQSSMFHAKDNHEEAILSTTISNVLDTSLEPIRPSRELEPPVKDMTQGVFSSTPLVFTKNPSPKTERNYSTTIQTGPLIPENKSLFRNPSNALASTSSTRDISLTGVTTLSMKEVKLTKNPVKINSRELEITTERSAPRRQQVAKKAQLEIAKTNANKASKVVLKDMLKNITTSTELKNSGSSNIQVIKTLTTQKPEATAIPAAVLEINFADTIFREDFPLPENNLTKTTEKLLIELPVKDGNASNKKQATVKLIAPTKIPVTLKTTNATQAKDTKNETSKATIGNKQPQGSKPSKLAHATGISPNETNKTTLSGQTKQFATNETLNLKPSVATKKEDLKVNPRLTNSFTFTQVSTPEIKHPNTEVTINSSPWRPIQTVIPVKQVLTKPSLQGTESPNVVSNNKRPLSIFELLDKFKPLSFRTFAPTHEPSGRMKRSENKMPKTIKTNLFKNLPGGNKTTENNKIEDRMHILKEIKNDPVFKNYVQAQRYRMVPITVPPFKKVPSLEHVKYIHIKHALKHIPPYMPPPTTQPSAYAEHSKIKY